ncbi:DUF4031 domain-containing protein [Xanthomonas arboricola]|uniref:DUF4031 domain-containing protein n=1 Tax=Xanthomonas arboricola TaxID=56448 RepID=UPI00226C4F98|nr:DUF4031 domain-containing protein [Xanthomonas arboricola]MCC8671282.1 DUF4031 domain-containing protein [Xanthomonas arboricola]
MAVYVDAEGILWRNRLWCHMVADSLDELHTFARQLGLRRQWFQDQGSYPHYDVTLHVREHALRLGAIDADRPTMISRCKALKSELAVVQCEFLFVLQKDSEVSNDFSKA